MQANQEAGESTLSNDRLSIQNTTVGGKRSFAHAYQCQNLVKTKMKHYNFMHHVDRRNIVVGDKARGYTVTSISSISRNKNKRQKKSCILRGESNRDRRW